MSRLFHIFNRISIPLLCVAVLGVSACSEKKEETNVLATLPPVHSLLYGVMKNVQEPELLMDEQETPHNIQLKPSDAELIKQSDMIVVTGLKAEAYLKPILDSISQPRSKLVETLNIPGLTIWPMVEGEGHEKKKKTPEPDMHIWMDPMNAVAITQYFVQELTSLMPKHAATFRQNGKLQIEQLHALHKELKTQFDEYGEPRKAAYVSYHPSLQYFEKRYRITGNVAATRTPHAGIRMSEAEKLREMSKDGSIKCLFKEPQFSPRMLETLSQEFNIPIKTVDPLGSAFPHNETLYFSMMRQTAATVLECLSYVPPTKKKKSRSTEDE